MATIHPGILNNEGLELWGQGDLTGARLHFLAALKIAPNFGPALANLAALTAKTWDRRSKLTAITTLRKLLAQNPHDGNQWNNLGTILMQIEHYAEAQVAMDRARALSPDLPAVWHNLALLCLRTARPREALEHLDRVVDFGSDSFAIQNDRAHAYLVLGELDSALEFYEARWATMVHLEPWDFYIPEWKGESLKGERILIHFEQGFGDTIMTSRFWKSLVARGAVVTLCVNPKLVRLFQSQDWPIEILDINNFPPDARERWDFHSPLYSVMRWLGIKSPADIDSSPYLAPPKVSIPNVLSPGFLNAGICWASGTRGNELDWRRRVTDLSLWLPLAEIPGIQLHSLYPDGAQEILDSSAEHLISDSTARLDDWAATAEFISRLDLVISVDTAIVHLAGALGCPVWMVSQYTNCWRWWNIGEGSGLPWYKSMKIIPAKEPMDWENQLDEVRKKLIDEVSEYQVAA